MRMKVVMVNAGFCGVQSGQGRAIVLWCTVWTGESYSIVVYSLDRGEL